MPGHIQRQFQSAPDPQFVERGSEIIFDDLLRGANDHGDLTVGEALLYQGGDLHFLGG